MAKRSASGLPEDTPTSARLSPRGCNTDEASQATAAEALNHAADPFNLKNPDKYRAYRDAHDKLFNDLGGASEIVAAQSVGPQGTKAGRENIVGSFIGRKFSNGKVMSGLAVVIQVKKKISNASLIDSNVAIPPSVKIGGQEIPTDVMAVGTIEAQCDQGPYQSFEQPAKCGASIGYEPTGVTGTLGVVCVTDSDPVQGGGKICILSNNHVMAGVNTGSTGDGITHPGAADPSSQTVRIAKLLRFVQVNLATTQQGGQVNYVDAALAWADPTKISASHHCFTINPTPLDWTINQLVKKEGRTTGYTEGQIIGGHGRSVISYEVPGGGTQYGYFEEQLVIVPSSGTLFSDRGDSGSLIVDLSANQPVGLLFSGGFDNDSQRTVTYANPIILVKQALNIDYFLSEMP